MLAEDGYSRALSCDDDYEKEERSKSSSSDSEEEERHCVEDRRGGVAGELGQHLVAALVSIIAAVATHAWIQGGLDAWRDELARDWSAGGGVSGIFRRVAGDAARDPADSFCGDNAPAPSMGAISVTKRRRALERSLGGDYAADKGGHARARNYRRTGGLSFCPANVTTDATSRPDGKAENNLVEMEFILPLEPSVHILHSHYLADALGTDSAMVYEEVSDLGSYASDKILNEIENVIEENEDEGLMLGHVRLIVESHLSKSLVDREHVCLLHQYSLNRASGRSIRGTTMVYDRPHVSTFYRSKKQSNSLGIPQSFDPNSFIPPASLTFTGHAVKFVNLSPQTLNLYWDGGRIPSGPREGEMLSVLVGTVSSMESVGTASFPGHSFYLTPTYDKDHVLKRWTITKDEPVLYYDPLFKDASAKGQRKELDRLVRDGKWTEKQRFLREAWAVNRSFERDYLIKTGRAWLANFPQPYLELHNGDHAAAESEDQGMYMWPADYIGQMHALNTSSLYYITLPIFLGRLAVDDYLPEAELRRHLEMRNFRSSSLKSKQAVGDEINMPITLKVLSCAPRVLEARRFLSLVEVQHLINLASGAKGDVVIERPPFLANSVVDEDTNKNVLGSKTDTRSSTGGWIHREQDAVVDAIFCRIADLLNIDEHLMRDKPRDYSSIKDGESGPLRTHARIVEAMQLLRYGPGEGYPAHHDFTHPSIANRYQPRRVTTVLIYLMGEGAIVKDGVGGEITFPRAITTDLHDGVKVKPESGKAVILYNVLPDGNMDDLSQHLGGNVENGVSYIANIWVWDPIVI